MHVPVESYDFLSPQRFRLQPATLRDRLIAQLIDGLILGMICGGLLFLLSGGQLYSIWVSPMMPVYLVEKTDDFVSLWRHYIWGGAFGSINLPLGKTIYISYPSPLFFLIYAVFYTYFTSGAGQTPGKRIKQLVVMDGQKRPLPPRQALLRWAAYAVSLAPLGAGIFSAAGHPQRQTWHDRLSKSQVMLYELR